MQLLFVSRWLPDTLWKAVGWTLVHSLWQGLLAAFAAALIIMATRRTPARLRYNLLCTLLVIFIAGSLSTFCSYAFAGTGLQQPVYTIAGPVPTITFNNTTLTTSVTALTPLEKFTLYFDEHAELFVLAWAVFFFFHGIKLVTAMNSIHRLRSYKKQEVPAEWNARFHELSTLLHIAKPVRLFQSALVKVPVAIGYFKPVVLVPLGLLSHLPADQAETVLLHELAHIRRHDYLVNFLQRVTEAVFFFNPALRWICSLVRQEREACCDDMVLAHVPRKGSYIEALVSFQEYSLSATGEYAMAIGQNRNHLLHRVQRMITRENKKLNIMEKIILLLSFLTITAFTWIPPIQNTPVKNVPHNAAIVVSVPNAQPLDVAKKTSVPGDMAIKQQAPITHVKDTLPQKIKWDDIRFTSISTSSDDDMNNRKETITATDQQGKKYTVNKLNDRITDFMIDGRSIPENQREQYAVLIGKLDHVVMERQAMNSRPAALQFSYQHDDPADAKAREQLLQKLYAEQSEAKEHQDHERELLLRELEEQTKHKDEQQKIMEDQKKKLEERRFEYMLDEQKREKKNRDEHILYEKKIEQDRKDAKKKYREMEEEIKKKETNDEKAPKKKEKNEE